MSFIIIRGYASFIIIRGYAVVQMLKTGETGPLS